MDSRRVFEILVREHSDMLTTYLRAVVWASVQVRDLVQAVPTKHQPTTFLLFAKMQQLHRSPDSIVR